MRVVTAAQMRDADARTIQEIGLPGLVLMENAGRQVVAAIEHAFKDLGEQRVAVVCGGGNNGGDGFVVARTLHQRGVEATVFLAAAADEVNGDARVNLDILSRLGVPIVDIAGDEQWELHAPEVASHDLIVDALFGTGLRRGLSGRFATIVADINDWPLPVVAIDLPSGASADAAELPGPTIDAALTVALGALKLPLVLPPGEDAAGQVMVADIGIPEEVFDEAEGPRIELVTRAQVREWLPSREVAAHKGDFGHVLVVAGSPGKTGAAVLSAQGALRAGAGLVTVACPAACQSVVAAHAPEYMTLALTDPSRDQGGADRIEQLDSVRATAMLLGPGLGRSDAVASMVRAIVARAGTTPIVLDADALNVFAGDPSALTGRDDRPVVISPHPGEMARLIGATAADVQADRLGIAREFSTTHRVYVVLKGHRTVTATPGGELFINPTGTPGMATGGTGDVLAGMIAALLAAATDAKVACCLAVYLHGLAGERAVAAVGEVAMTAGDLVAHVGPAILDITKPARDHPHAALVPLPLWRSDESGRDRP